MSCSVADGNSVWAIPFSPAQVRATGEPFLVADNAAYPSGSVTGSLVFTRGSSSSLAGSRMAWADRSGRIVSQFGDPQSGMSFPALSVDATKIAYIVAASPPYMTDIWVHDLRLNARTQLTQTPDDEMPVSWAPHEPRIFYSYAREDEDSHPIEGVSMHIASLAINKNEGRRDFGPGNVSHGQPRRAFPRVYAEWPPHVQGTRRLRIRKYATDGTSDVYPRLSPDGRLLAFGSLEPHPGLIVTTFPGSALRWRLRLSVFLFGRAGAVPDRSFTSSH